MKGVNTWYDITTAWPQPAGSGEGASGIAHHCQRSAAIHSSHHVIAASTLTAPTKNSRRCGAASSSAGEGNGEVGFALSMAAVCAVSDPAALIQVTISQTGAHVWGKPLALPSFGRIRQALAAARTTRP